MLRLHKVALSVQSNEADCSLRRNPVSLARLLQLSCFDRVLNHSSNVVLLEF